MATDHRSRRAAVAAAKAERGERHSDGDTRMPIAAARRVVLVCAALVGIMAFVSAATFFLLRTTPLLAPLHKRPLVSLAEGRSVPTGGTRWRRVRAMGRSGPQSGPFGPSSIEPSEFVTFVTFADLRSTEIAF